MCYNTLDFKTTIEGIAMTEHRIIVGDSSNMVGIADASVDLIVTSPPYPMIEMWDAMFIQQDETIGEDINAGKGMSAFTKMHALLNKVWAECDRILANNGFICINIGDATRTINGEFQLFPNHATVIAFFQSMGYSVLPDIHWRKQSNAPNKFMGSGMYPAGAYVTYEHEYILIFRKGGKRVFSGISKTLRQKSAFFWEERNVWFSDLWDIKGTSQEIRVSKTSRERNASFPLEVPYRLVNMYSTEGDTILDPFAGFGTTNIACMLSKRNSIGFEIDSEIARVALDRMNLSVLAANDYIDSRIQKHLGFIEALPEDKRAKCYLNQAHGFMVKTRQETLIELDQISNIKRTGSTLICEYMKYQHHDKPEQISMVF